MINIRKITLNDIDKIVSIHVDAFPNFFLTTLGPSFLKTYYKALVQSQEGVGICALNDNQIVGFSAGTINSSGFHKRLIINNFLVFAAQFFIIILSRPNAILRLLKNLEKKTNHSINSKYAELLSIGIGKDFSGKGIGKNLLKEFENTIALSDSKIIVLTTDYYNNDKVLSFYKQNGYEIFADFISYPNRRMYKLIKKL